jgi:hypothetical protein
MLSEYRQRFIEFHTEIHRDNYLFRSGQKSRSEKRAILSEHSDLFTTSKIEELQKALKGITPHRETDRASIRRLLRFALSGSIAASAEELADEISRYENNATIDWMGESRSISAGVRILADEPDAARRSDLFARVDEALGRVDDLRAERMAGIRESTTRLGFEDYPSLVQELCDLDLTRLAASAEGLTSKTESHYLNAVAPLVAQQTGLPLDQAKEADLKRFRRYTRFDHFFQGEQMLRAYRDLFAALGFRTESQRNLELDAAVRPNKQPRAFCSPIRVPEKVILCCSQEGGQANFQDLFEQAGRAQHCAWTSRSLPPEFCSSGAFELIDGAAATKLAWGMLLKNLFLDERWLMSSFGFAESQRFRRVLAAFRLMDVRRWAALVRYDLEFHGPGELVNPGGRYGELITEAIRLRTGESGRLRETASPFRASDFLRACAFESQMREYLKTKFGLRWWASSKAGETLIDLWNTGERYSVEELASSFGLGDLDYEWLATELQTQTTENA